MKRKRIWESIKYYAVGVYKYSEEDHCFLLAAGIAFNVLYCMLPLSLVIFYFFSAALTSTRAIGYVVGYITESFPIPISEANLRVWMTGELSRVGHKHAVAGIIGGITLFWLASVLFSTLRTSVNAVFNMVSKKNMILEKLLDFLLMLLVLVLLLVSTFLSPVVNLIQRFGTDLLPAWLSGTVNSTIPRFVTLAISIVLYGILFRMLPHEKLSRNVIIVSAATSVVLTEAMRFLFVYYMAHISSIRSLYGTYAFLVGISLWLYYASLAFLIGAEVGWLYKERHEPETIELHGKSSARPTRLGGKAKVSPKS
jgi:membrane protein